MSKIKAVGFTTYDLKSLQGDFAKHLFKDSDALARVLDLTVAKIKRGQEFYILDLELNRPRKVTFYESFEAEEGRVAIFRDRGFITVPNFYRHLLSKVSNPAKAYYLTYDEALDALITYHEAAIIAARNLRTCSHG